MNINSCQRKNWKFTTTHLRVSNAACNLEKAPSCNVCLRLSDMFDANPYVQLKMSRYGLCDRRRLSQALPCRDRAREDRPASTVRAVIVQIPPIAPSGNILQSLPFGSSAVPPVHRSRRAARRGGGRRGCSLPFPRAVRGAAIRHSFRGASPFGGLHGEDGSNHRLQTQGKHPAAAAAAGGGAAAAAEAPS